MCQTKTEVKTIKTFRLWNTLLFFLLIFVAATVSTQTTTAIYRRQLSHVESCHDNYMAQSANASNAYIKNYEVCELLANSTISNLSMDEQAERLKLEAGRVTVCENLERCSAHENDLDYYGCMVDIGPTNLNVLVEMRYNATAAYIQLREDMDGVRQDFLLCTIKASQKFVKDLRSAFEELLKCRARVGNDTEN